MKVLSKICYLVVLLKMADLIMAEYLFTNKFLKTTCNVSGETAVDPFCFISTDNQSLNLGCTVKRSLNKVNFSIKAFYKYGNGFRQIVKSSPMNWADVIEGKNLNPFFKILVSLIRKTAPMLFQHYPWIGKFAVYNLSVEKEKYFSVFPKRIYKFDFFIEDEIDKFIYGGIVITSFTSSVKLEESKSEIGTILLLL